MYEPYDDKKGSFFKRLANKIKDRWEAFKQDLHFNEGSTKNILIVVIPLVLIALIGISYTGYVTYTARITEAQSKVMVMEKQLTGLEQELISTKNDLSACNNNLDKTKNDLQETKNSLEKSLKNVDSCIVEKQELESDINDLTKKYNDLDTKFKTLESNFKSLECNWAKSKGCLYYVLKSNNIDCVVKIADKYYTIPVGIEVKESEVRIC
ncbi:MAG: hypothetical protein QXM68_01230 [Candidatus Aenigmatarchaeota archaeon]|nr:hypothetical protein [Candidatus Aenigmarchaeota archaeon]